MFYFYNLPKNHPRVNQFKLHKRFFYSFYFAYPDYYLSPDILFYSKFHSENLEIILEYTVVIVKAHFCMCTLRNHLVVFHLLYDYFVLSFFDRT